MYKSFRPIQPEVMKIRDPNEVEANDQVIERGFNPNTIQHEIII
jgi:hypothetical protein